ncbi:Bulb-type lectin domain containing protein [Trema orientale]|uniref:Bulb-type lectin domain containing protein n=1 Tax=Trema orientale TaxID=63057 RepID=A0A2P5EDK0_TREOI|nr:Bulb-type lectin domain containing protein [Trema orientale]
MVLHDSNGNFVWQSFDHLTDTILVGQGAGAQNKLVSRLSAQENEDGPCSFVLEPKGVCTLLQEPELPKAFYFTTQQFGRFCPLQDPPPTNSQSWESECQLPDRCVTFGVCEDNKCVAWPMENGLLGWTKNCEPKKVSSCKPSDFHYYKVGVDHFFSKYTRGDKVKESDCGNKCTRDCKVQVLGVLLQSAKFKMLDRL